MGAAAVGRCGAIENCASLGEGGREKIDANSGEGKGELREKTYVTARADADTALPISVRSQMPTARVSPRFDVAAESVRAVPPPRNRPPTTASPISLLPTAPPVTTASVNVNSTQGSKTIAAKPAASVAPVAVAVQPLAASTTTTEAGLSAVLEALPADLLSGSSVQALPESLLVSSAEPAEAKSSHESLPADLLTGSAGQALPENLLVSSPAEPAEAKSTSEALPADLLTGSSGQALPENLLISSPAEQPEAPRGQELAVTVPQTTPELVVAVPETPPEMTAASPEPVPALIPELAPGSDNVSPLVEELQQERQSTMPQQKQMPDNSSLPLEGLL